MPTTARSLAMKQVQWLGPQWHHVRVQVGAKKAVHYSHRQFSLTVATRSSSVYASSSSYWKCHVNNTGGLLLPTRNTSNTGSGKIIIPTPTVRPFSAEPWNNNESSSEAAAGTSKDHAKPKLSKPVPVSKVDEQHEETKRRRLSEVGEQTGSRSFFAKSKIGRII